MSWVPRTLLLPTALQNGSEYVENHIVSNRIYERCLYAGTWSMRDHTYAYKSTFDCYDILPALKQEVLIARVVLNRNVANKVLLSTVTVQDLLPEIVTEK